MIGYGATLDVVRSERSHVVSLTSQTLIELDADASNNDMISIDDDDNDDDCDNVEDDEFKFSIAT